MYNKIFHTYIKKYLNIPNITGTLIANGDTILLNDIEIPTNQAVQDANFLLNSKVMLAVLNNIKVASETHLKENCFETKDLYFPKASLYVLNEIYRQLEAISSIELDNQNK